MLDFYHVFIEIVINTVVKLIFRLIDLKSVLMYKSLLGNQLIHTFSFKFSIEKNSVIRDLSGGLIMKVLLCDDMKAKTGPAGLFDIYTCMGAGYYKSISYKILFFLLT